MPGQDQTPVSEHLTSEVLWEIATQREHPHLATCTDCQRAVELYVGVLREQRSRARAMRPPSGEIAPAPLPDNVRTMVSSARGADELARNLVDVALDDDLFQQALEAAGKSPSRRLALVYALRRAPILLLRDLPAAERFVASIEAVATGLPSDHADIDLEILLYRSQMALVRGEPADAAALAREARKRRQRGDAFTGARIDYFEAAARGFSGDHAAALALAEKALGVFIESFDEAWLGRTEAAIGLIHLQKGDEVEALDWFEMAREKLDPEEDVSPLIGCLVNLGVVLANLGRFDDARSTQVEALELSMRHGLTGRARDVRVNLAQLDFLTQNYQRALASFTGLVAAAEDAGMPHQAAYCRLYLAETYGILGRRDEMVAALEPVRELASAIGPNPGIEELFYCLDRGDLDVAVVSHVRRYVDQLSRGRDVEYRRLRVA